MSDTPPVDLPNPQVDRRQPQTITEKIAHIASATVPGLSMERIIIVGLIGLVPLFLSAVCYLSLIPGEFSQQMSKEILDLLKVVVGGVAGWGTMFVSAMVSNMKNNGGSQQ